MYRFSDLKIYSLFFKTNERSKKIFLTASSSIFLKAVQILISFLSVPIAIKHLGSESYGLWMSASSVLSLIAFVDFGLGTGLMNVIASSKGSGDKLIAQKSVSSTFFLLILISIILTFCFVYIIKISPWLSYINLSKSISSNLIKESFIALAIPFLISMPLGVTQRIQEGEQMGYKFQQFQVLGSILGFLFFLIGIYFKAKLPFLIFLNSFGPLVSNSINTFILFRKNFPYLKPKLKNIDIKIAQNIFKTGVLFFILNFFSLISNSSDNLIIASKVGLSSVTIYDTVRKIFLLTMITQFFITPLWPAFREAFIKKEYLWIKTTYFKYLKITVIIGSLLTLPLLIFGPYIFKFWLGDKFIPSFSLIFGFYLFGFQVNYGGVNSVLLNSSMYLKEQIYFIGLSSICAILLKLYLIPRYGFEAAIWSTMIAYSIFYVIPSWMLTKKIFKINISF